MRLKKKNIGITIFAVSLVAVTAVNLHKVCKINTEYSNNIKDHQAETAVTTVIPIETEKLPTQEEIEKKQTKTIETSLVTEKEKMRKAKPVTVKEVTVKKKETTPTVTTVTQSQISKNTAKETIRETQNTRSTQDYITKNDCGEEYEELFDIDGNILCENCALDYITDNFFVKELVEALGIGGVIL